MVEVNIWDLFSQCSFPPSLRWYYTYVKKKKRKNLSTRKASRNLQIPISPSSLIFCKNTSWYILSKRFTQVIFDSYMIHAQDISIPSSKRSLQSILDIYHIRNYFTSPHYMLNGLTRLCSSSANAELLDFQKEKYYVPVAHILILI